MKRNLDLFVALLLVIMLTGCEFGIEGDIYVQDLVELPTLSEPLFVPASFSVDYTSEDRQGELKAFLEQNLRNARNFRIEEHGYSEYSVVDFDIPLLGSNDLETGLAAIGDDLFSVLAEYGDDSTATLYAVFNLPKFHKLQQTLKDQYWVDLTIENATIIFNLVNDLRTDVSVQVMLVYANGMPAATPQQITMARRNEIVIRFSDVLRDSLAVQYSTDNPRYTARAFAVVTLPTN